MAAAGDNFIFPQFFHGKSTENAKEWLQYIESYFDYKELSDEKKLKLFKLLLRDTAADWYCNLPENQTDSIEHLMVAFRARYDSSDIVKYRSAQTVFQRKQLHDESVDEYSTFIYKKFKELFDNPDDKMMKFVFLSGLRPSLSTYVLQQQPETLSEAIKAARIAEATVTSSKDDTLLHELMAEVKNLGQRFDRCSTSALRQRSPTLERRQRLSVSFADNASTGQDSSGPHRPMQPQNPQPGRRTAPVSTSQPSSAKCPRCGYEAHPHPSRCPAIGQLCAYCRKPNHFRRVCRAAQRARQH
jgi:Retrotransposon gag protein